MDSVADGQYRTTPPHLQPLPAVSSLKYGRITKFCGQNGVTGRQICLFLYPSAGNTWKASLVTKATTINRTIEKRVCVAKSFTG